MTNYTFDSEVVELSYEAGALLLKMIGGQVVKCSYGSDGAFTAIETYTESGGGSSTTYTFGDGLTETNGTVSVTTPVNGILTQEEFDALPDEQKSKGVYVISG